MKGHHILSGSMASKVLGALLVLTIVTVAAARVDLGAFNFPVAMAIATVKALLVVLFFMGMKYDTADNRVIFGTSFIFVAIFMILTSADLFTRGDVTVRAPFFAPVAGGPPKFEKPWVSNDEILKHGSGLFKTNCISCHGDSGNGAGPAAASLNPKPRNFTVASGWKSGRKPSQIFMTLTKGLNTMPSFGSIPAEDRWALAHYVTSLGPNQEADTPQDLTVAGIDPSKKYGGMSAGDDALPVDFAIEIMADNR
jgi:caa(3)-type oxidase subunit IV